MRKKARKDTLDHNLVPKAIVVPMKIKKLAPPEKPKSAAKRVAKKVGKK